jgi:hypothetical protein
VQTNKNLLIVEQHAVDSFNSGFCRFSGLVVYKSVALGVSSLIGGNFAGKDIPERNECIMKGLQQLSSWDSASVETSSLALLSIPSSRFLMKIFP